MRLTYASRDNNIHSSPKRRVFSFLFLLNKSLISLFNLYLTEMVDNSTGTLISGLRVTLLSISIFYFSKS
nr:MAG TPA: hypothetical protein [Caudoviricetes sp.]